MIQKASVYACRDSTVDLALKKRAQWELIVPMTMPLILYHVNQVSIFLSSLIDVMRRNIPPTNRIPSLPGTFNFMIGQAECTICPLGGYCPSYGLKDPVICPPGEDLQFVAL